MEEAPWEVAPLSHWETVQKKSGPGRLGVSSLTQREGWRYTAFLTSSSGVQIHERTSISHVSVQKGRVTGVETDRGQIRCQYFVNCAGQVGFFLSFCLGWRTCTLSLGCLRYVFSAVTTQLAVAVSQWYRHQGPDNSTSAGWASLISMSRSYFAFILCVDTS